MSFYQLKKSQFIAASPEEVWEFISSPENLKVITPGEMGFEVLSKDLPRKIYPGMIIRYRVKPLFGIPVTWVSEITQISEGKSFIDVQHVGPYSFWHHQHILEVMDGGVLMRDIISYRPPLGFIGAIANSFIIRNKLEKIFQYREKVLKERFPEKKKEV